MKHVSISFHRSILWREHWLGFLCLGCGLLIAIATFCFGWQIYAKHQRWHEYLATLRQASSTHKADESADKKEAIKTELQAASDVIEQLDTPWAGLFSVLEGVYSDNAILLSADPDPVARSIRLTAEAKDTSSMLAFVRLLRQSKVLGDAYVISHVANQQDAQHPIRFVVSSHWFDVSTPIASDPTSVPAAAIVATPEKGGQ